MSDEPVDGNDEERGGAQSSPTGTDGSREGDADADGGADPADDPDDSDADAASGPTDADGDDGSSAADEDGRSADDGDDGSSATDGTDDPSTAEADDAAADDAAADDAAADDTEADGGERTTSTGVEIPDPEEYPQDTDDGGGGGGLLGTPPDDEEMPLTAHIEEMLGRLAIVVVLAALATLAVFPWANDAIIHVWYDVHPGTIDACQATPQEDGCVPPHVYGPLELVLVRIRVAGLAGLLVALPVLVYQTYQFMRPGLYPHERRYYLAAVPFSLVLGVIGMLFAYFVVLPLLFGYFVTYSEGSAELAFHLADTMNLVLIMMAMLAVIFQIPLLVLLAVMMGLTSRRWLERRRLYFWALFLGIAFIFGPDPTGMAPILLTVTMVILFEATLLLLRWTGR